MRGPEAPIFVIDFAAEVPPVSENFLYKPALAFGKGGRRYVHLYKDERVVAYQKALKEAFDRSVDLEILPPPPYVAGIVTCYIFGLRPERFWERDLSNMIKATEDTLFSKDQEKFNSVLPYDDSQVVASSQRKMFSDTNFVCVKVGLMTSPDDVEFDCLATLMMESRNVDPLAFCI